MASEPVTLQQGEFEDASAAPSSSPSSNAPVKLDAGEFEEASSVHAPPAPLAGPNDLDAFYQKQRAERGAAPIQGNLFVRRDSTSSIPSRTAPNPADAAIEQTSGPALALRPNQEQTPQNITQQVQSIKAGSRIAPAERAPLSTPGSRTGGEQVQGVQTLTGAPAPGTPGYKAVEQGIGEQQHEEMQGEAAMGDNALQAGKNLYEGTRDIADQTGEDFDKKRTVQALTKIISGGSQVGIALGAPELVDLGIAADAGDIAAQASIVKLLATAEAGNAASDIGGNYLQKHTKLSPETVELVRTGLFFIPSLIGAHMLKGGVGVDAEGNPAVGVSTPGGGFRAGVRGTPEAFEGRVQVGGTRFGVDIPRGEAAPGQEALPPSPESVQAAAAQEGAVQTAIKAQSIQKAAADRVAGVPPPPPPPKPKQPAGMEQGQLTQTTVAQAASIVSSLPPAQRGPAMLEAHANLAKWMQEQGKFIGPDGKLQIADTPQKAQKLAQDVLNAEVDRQTQEVQQKQEAAATAQKEADKQAAQVQKDAGKKNENGLTSEEQRAARVKTVVADITQSNPKWTEPQIVNSLANRMAITRADAQNLYDQHKVDAIPTVGGKGHEVVEEDKATIDKQIDALKAGTISTIHLPEGSKYIPKAPEGAKVVKVTGDVPGAGTYITKLRAATVKEAAKAGTHGDLLGHVQPKEEATNGEQPEAVVQAVAQDGTPIQDSVVHETPEKVNAQAAVLHERHPDAHIQVKSPEEVLAQREASKETATAVAEPEEGEEQPVKLEAGEFAEPEGAAKSEEVKGDRGESPEPEKGVEVKAPESEEVGEFRTRQARRKELMDKVAKNYTKPYDADLHDALLSFDGGSERFEKLHQEGATDAQILENIKKSFGTFGGSSGNKSRGSIGHDHAIDKFWHGGRSSNKLKPTLQGAALVKEVRRLMDIPQAEGEQAEKPLAKGDMVEAPDRAGKVRSGKVAHTNESITRIRLDDGKEITVPTKKAKHAKTSDEVEKQETSIPAKEEPKPAEAEKKGAEPETESPESPAETSARRFLQRFDESSYEASIRNLEAKGGGHIPTFDEVRDGYWQHLTEGGDPMTAKDFARSIAHATGDFHKNNVANQPSEPEVKAPEQRTYQAEVSKFAGDPNSRTESVQAENRRQAEALLQEKFPAEKVSSAERVENTVANTESEAENVANEQPATQPEGRSSSSGDELARGDDREPVAEVAAGLLPAASGEGNAEGRGSRNGSDVRKAPEAIRGERPEPRPGEGSDASLDSSPARVTVEKANKELEKAPPKLNRGWYTHPDTWQPPPGVMGKLDANLDALRILRDIEKKPRKPTPAEMEKLANYVGWGSLQHAFDPYRADYSSRQRFIDANRELTGLLSPDELAAARRSTQNAHYTSPELVRYMWDLAKRFGFDGGNILEPSMGSGNFFGMMPKSIRNNVTAMGNELDPVTSGIAKLLYPDATIFNKDFVQLVLPDNSVDFAISNVPFGVKVYDPKYPKINAQIHDYFFIKTLDKIRPGGVIAFITSTGTMDKPGSAQRDILASKANLIGAIRLPSGAFQKNAGTAVTTDLIILQKRSPGEQPNGTAWTAASKVKVPGREGYGPAEVSLNEYFQKNPEMMLGKPGVSTMYGKDGGFALYPHEDKSMSDLLKDAFNKLPKGIMRSEKAVGIDQASTPAVLAKNNQLEGQFVLDDKGNLKQIVDGRQVRPEVVEGKDGSVSVAKVSRIKEMVGVRNSLNELLSSQMEQPNDDRGNAAVAKKRDELNKTYDKFVKKYGPLNATANNVFEDDPHYPRLLALEDFNQNTKTVTPATIFTKRTMFPREELTSVSKDQKDALYQVLAERGYPDLGLMAKLQGVDAKELAQQLIDKGMIYRNPTSGEYEMKEKYLAGYVRDKLDDARNAVKQGLTEYTPNVEALEKVLPKDIPIKEIEVKLGATWILLPAINDFIKDTFKIPYPVQIEYRGGTWSVPRLPATAEVSSQYGTPRVHADELMQDALNQKEISIYDKIDGVQVLNQAETLLARQAQQKIRDAFNDWSSGSEKWANPLEKAYNYAYNNLVIPDYDGSHLTFPGMNASVTLRPHQRDAIWRVIQDGRALLAHVVGAGKTFEMAASIMEGRRTGVFRKPLLTVPNHLVGQWQKEFLHLYPGANILVPTPKDFDSKNRQRLMSKIATGDYDAVIMAHSQFDLMDISPELQAKTMESMMEELEETIRGLKQTNDDKRTVKQMEKAKDQLRTRIEKLKDLKADKAINFDDTGVDALFVDEAHRYKNLAFYTKMTRVAGLAQGDSKRAIRLKAKTDYLLGANNNRGVIFATGTPIQNTMAEQYNMTKYVAPDALEKAGIKYFDDWAANFGSVRTVNEVSADGRSFKARTKFSRFTNVPELMNMFRSFTDIKTAKMLNLPTPKLEGGKPEATYIQPSAAQEEYMASLVKRAEKVKHVDPKIDNMLKIVSDGRKAALDMRLIDPEAADDPHSKINQVVDDVYKEWKAGKEGKLTQLVFLDMYRALDKEETRNELGQITDTKHHERLNLYDDMRRKWIDMGIPDDQIAVMGDYDTEAKKAKLFAAVNDGDTRILMGSTEKMGAGTNVQQRLKVLHHVDLPWRPGDLAQRTGRIERQGNRNEEVKVKYWLTQKSFDTYMLQALEAKANFIEQIMAGKFNGRTMEDLDSSVSMNLQDMKVATSGNPDIKLKYDLMQEEMQLQTLRRGHDMRRRDDISRAGYLRSRAARNTGLMQSMEKSLAKSKEAKGKDGEGFSMEVDGKKFTDRKTAFEHLDAMEVPSGNFWMTMNGIGVSVKTLSDEMSPVLRYTMEYTGDERDANTRAMASLGRGIEYQIRNLAENVQSEKESIAEDIEKATKLEELAKVPFGDDAKLEAVSKQLKEVDARLGLGGPIKDTAPEQAVEASEEPETPETEGDEEEGENKPAVKPKGEGKPTLRSSLFGVDVLAEFMAEQGAKFYKADIEPSLKKLGPTIQKAAKQLTDVLYPRIGANLDALDSLMEAKGEREEHRVMIENLDGGLEKFFDKMPREAQIAFMDRAKMGIDQLGASKEESERLQNIRSLFEMINQQTTARVLEYRPNMALRDHYWGMMWKTIPDVDGRHAAKNEARANGMKAGGGRRPFEGAKGFLKRSSLENITEGINMGGIPITYNPAKMFRLMEMQKMQYITAQDHWKRLKQLGLRKFVKHGETPPQGWSPLNDRLAKIFFPASSGEGMVHAGDWYLEHSSALLLNNYLSRDLIRENEIGKALMALKMVSTGIELSLSPFHLIFEGLEAMGSQLGLGSQKFWNTGVRNWNTKAMSEGAKTAATFMAAPFLISREGGNVLRSIRSAADFAKTKRGLKFLKLYPDAAQMTHDLYTGGLTWGINEDFKAAPLTSFREAVRDGNYVGAMVRAIPALNDAIMHPLFGILIPRLKWGLALQQYSQQLAENAEAIANGEKTRAQVARQVVDTIENRLGELNYSNIFWNNTFKTSMQFNFRSVTWKLGTWRGFSSAAGPEVYEAFADPLKAMYEDVRGGKKTHDTKDYIPKIGPNQAWLFGMTALTVTLGTIIGYMLNGKMPWDYVHQDKTEGYSAPGAILLEAIHPRTGKVNKRTGLPERISLPTGMKDFEHAFHSPAGYVNSSLSGTVARFLDVAENRDFFNNYVYDPNAPAYKKAAEIFAYAVPRPIGLENWSSEFGSQDFGSKALRAAGFNASSSQGFDESPAEEHMDSIARSKHTPETPDQQAAYREKNVQGKPTIAQVRSAMRHGNREHVQEQFNRLGYADARDIFYNYATPRERALLRDMLEHKRRTALHKDHRDGTAKVAKADADYR